MAPPKKLPETMDLHIRAPIALVADLDAWVLEAQQELPGGSGITRTDLNPDGPDPGSPPEGRRRAPGDAEGQGEAMTENKTEKPNGHDPIAVEMLAVLKGMAADIAGIRGDVSALNGRVDALGADLSSVKNELSSLRAETRAEFILLREEVHELRTELREDLGARVRKLEEAVFKKAS
jgi:hypothetical protein